MIAVVEDLFFGIKISDAAKRAGARMVFAKTPEAFWQRMEDLPALVVFDLNYSTMNPLSLVAALTASERFSQVPTVGYLPHVQDELRQAAIAAGCAKVLPRSAFSTQVDALVQEALAATSAR